MRGSRRAAIAPFPEGVVARVERPACVLFRALVLARVFTDGHVEERGQLDRPQIGVDIQPVAQVTDQEHPIRRERLLGAETINHFQTCSPVMVRYAAR